MWNVFEGEDIVGKMIEGAGIGAPEKKDQKRLNTGSRVLQLKIIQSYMN